MTLLFSQSRKGLNIDKPLLRQTDVQTFQGYTPQVHRPQ